MVHQAVGTTHAYQSTRPLNPHLRCSPDKNSPLCMVYVCFELELEAFLRCSDLRHSELAITSIYMHAETPLTT